MALSKMVVYPKNRFLLGPTGRHGQNWNLFLKTKFDQNVKYGVNDWPKKNAHLVSTYM